MTAFALPTAEHKLSLLLDYYSMNAGSLIQTVLLSSKVSILCFEPLHCSLANFSNVVPLKLRERLMLHTIEVSVLLLHKLQHGEESQQPKALSCMPEYLQ